MNCILHYPFFLSMRINCGPCRARVGNVRVKPAGEQQSVGFTLQYTLKHLSLWLLCVESKESLSRRCQSLQY